METPPTEIVVRSSRLKSAVWNDFERVKRGDVMVAICKHCKKKLSASATSGTSHLKNHLNRCRKRNNRDLAQQLLFVRGRQRDGTISVSNFKFDHDPSPLDFKFDAEHSRLDLKFDQERSRFDLARMIILHEYPLSMVEHAGFKRFVVNLQPSFQFISCDTVKSDCIQIYQKEKQKVYDMLGKVFHVYPGRLSLTADLWTSYQEHGYLCLTAHYFDETWASQKKILNFVMVDPHSEQSLSESIITCLMNWGIDRKLFSMTFDSCFSNEVVFRIRERLSQNRLLVNNGQLFHVRCATNILNLIVQDILESLREVIHKVRESVRYIKSSEASQQKFREMAQQIMDTTQRDLCLDCPTQWNSTYAMLETAVNYRDVFSRLQTCDASYTLALTDVEWERASVVSNYLKLFVEVSNIFFGMKYPTANLYFPELCDIHLQLIEWCENIDPFIKSMALRMRSRFDTYWSVSSLALAVAAILDPRFKMKLVEYYYPQIYGSCAADRIEEVSNCIQGIYGEYEARSPLHSSNDGLACDLQTSGGVTGVNGALPSANIETRDRLRGFDKFLYETSDNQHVKSELDKYLEEPVFPRNVDFNILNWWKVNAPKYPILSMMAHDVLGIPMSTVTSGSAFKTLGKVLDPYRSSLQPEVLEALICAHDWLQAELEDSDPVPSNSAMALCVTAN